MMTTAATSGSIDDFFDPKKQDIWSVQGERIRVVHCEGALDSYFEALSSVQKGKARSFTMRMKTQILKLADTGRLSKENFPDEAELPGVPGKPRRKFQALKRIPIRGYCWRSERCPNTIFISHYVFKNYQNLKSKDTRRVHSNWNRVEEQHYDR